MPLCSNSPQSLWTSTLWCNVPGTLLDTWEAKLHPPFQSVQLWLPENRQQNMERSCKLTHHHWWKQLRIQNLYKENHHSIILFPDLLIQTLLLCNCCSCPLSSSCCPGLVPDLSSFMLSPAQPHFQAPTLGFPTVASFRTWDSITYT